MAIRSHAQQVVMWTVSVLLTTQANSNRQKSETERGGSWCRWLLLLLLFLLLLPLPLLSLLERRNTHTHTHKGRQFASRRANQQITWSPVNQCEYKCKWLNPKLRPLNWSLTFVGDCSCSVGGDFRLKQRRVSFNWVAKLTFQFSLGELVLGKPFEFSSKTRSFCYTNLALTYAIHSCKVKHSTDPSLSSKYSLVSDIWFLAWKI